MRMWDSVLFREFLILLVMMALLATIIDIKEKKKVCRHWYELMFRRNTHDRPMYIRYSIIMSRVGTVSENKATLYKTSVRHLCSSSLLIAMWILLNKYCMKQNLKSLITLVSLVSGFQANIKYSTIWKRFSTLFITHSGIKKHKLFPKDCCGIVAFQ